MWQAVLFCHLTSSFAEPVRRPLARHRRCHSSQRSQTSVPFLINLQKSAKQPAVTALPLFICAESPPLRFGWRAENVRMRRSIFGGMRGETFMSSSRRLGVSLVEHFPAPFSLATECVACITKIYDSVSEE